jgi:hypothetical protein
VDALRSSSSVRVEVDGTVLDDLAWAYDFPTVACAAIAGRIAFYNEHVDLYVDGVPLPRPTALSRAEWDEQQRAARS